MVCFCHYYTQTWIQFLIDGLVFAALLVLEVFYISHHFLMAPLFVALGILFKDIYASVTKYNLTPQLRIAFSLVATINIITSVIIVFAVETSLISVLVSGSQDKLVVFVILCVLVIVVVVSSHVDALNSMLIIVYEANLTKRMRDDAMEDDTDGEGDVTIPLVTSVHVNSVNPQYVMYQNTQQSPQIFCPPPEPRIEPQDLHRPSDGTTITAPFLDGKDVPVDYPSPYNNK